MADTYGTADSVESTGAKSDNYDSTNSEPRANAECVKRYWAEIERYERATTSWYEKVDKIISRYLDENHEDNSERRFALLWSNVETLKPAVYAKLPIALCERRYRDRDPVGRVASEIMERCTNTALDIGGVDEVFRQVRDDRLLAGRGQAWVRYDAEIETVETPVIDLKTRQRTIQKHDRLKSERLRVDYVYWRHFGHNLARTWSGVWCVWRICHYQKWEATEKFGEEIANKLKYTTRRKGSDNEDIEANVAEIYEVWDSRKQLMSCIVKGDELPIDSGPPPINFSRFFPCPEPCFATKTSKSMIPVPDYEYYRDQAKDIDDLTAKISNMLDWLRVKAFIPRAPSGGGADAVQDLLMDTTNDDVFVHVSSWAEWVEKGGAKGLIDWLPLDMIVAALQQAIQARSQLIQDVYQITGISDILRGQTDPDETFGAQNIKQSTGSRRLRNAKDEQARFCEDICRLMAEASAENFQPQTLAQMSGFAYTPGKPTVAPAPAPQLGVVPPAQPPGVGSSPGLGSPPGPGVVPPAPGGLPPQPGVQAIGANGPPSPIGAPAAAPPPAPPPDEVPMTFGDDVVELLRNDMMRTFRIKVETDSTTQPDDDQEKQRRIEFLNNVAAYLEKAVGALQMSPSLAPAVKEILMFTARGFRVGRNMESVIEEAIDRIASEAKQPKPDKIDAVNQAKLQQSDAQHKQKMEEDRARFQQESVQRDQMHRQTLAQNDQQFGQQMAFEREKGEKEIAVQQHRAIVEQQNKRIERADKATDQVSERQAALEDGEREAAEIAEPMAAHGAKIEEIEKMLEGVAGGLEGLAKQVARIMDDFGAPVPSR